MAHFKSTAVSRDLRNSMDEITFCQTRGIGVAKTKIDENKSNTLLQRKQRLRWASLLILDSIFDEAIIIGFPTRPRRLTAHNAFMKANVTAVQVSEELEATVDYPKIVCTQGRLTVPTVSVTVEAEQKKLTFTHKQERYGKRHKPNDQLYAMVVDKTLGEGELFQLDTREDKDPVVVELQEEWTMANLAVYVFALSADGRMASNTKYVKVG